jgi:hypothetical protein
MGGPVEFPWGNPIQLAKDDWDGQGCRAHGKVKKVGASEPMPPLLRRGWSEDMRLGAGNVW